MTRKKETSDLPMPPATRRLLRRVKKTTARLQGGPSASGRCCLRPALEQALVLILESALALALDDIADQPPPRVQVVGQGGFQRQRFIADPRGQQFGAQRRAGQPP